MLSSLSPKPVRAMPAHEWWHRCHPQVPSLTTSRRTKRYWHRSVCRRPLSPVSPLSELRCLTEEILAFPWWPYICGTLKQSLVHKGMLSFPIPDCLITCCFRSWTRWSNSGYSNSLPGAMQAITRSASPSSIDLHGQTFFCFSIKKHSLQQGHCRFLSFPVGCKNSIWWL